MIDLWFQFKLNDSWPVPSTREECKILVERWSWRNCSRFNGQAGTASCKGTRKQGESDAAASSLVLSSPRIPFSFVVRTTGTSYGSPSNFFVLRKLCCWEMIRFLIDQILSFEFELKGEVTLSKMPSLQQVISLKTLSSS